MPIDKDAIAQFIGFMGEMVMNNPLFMGFMTRTPRRCYWRFYDSNAAALFMADEEDARASDPARIENQRGGAAGAIEDRTREREKVN